MMWAYAAASSAKSRWECRKSNPQQKCRGLGLFMEMPPHLGGGVPPAHAGTVTAAAVSSRRIGDGHRLALRLGVRETEIRLSGALDVAAVEDLCSIFERLESLVMPVSVDLAEVTFLDSTGLWPLIEATRQRERSGVGALLIVDRSRQAQFFLDVAALDGNPRLDVECWDRYY
jgi:ABC-type transporter Mla MlaB component